MASKENKMSVPMQAAAVRVALAEKMSLDDIEKKHPELAEGVALVREEQAPTTRPRTRRGSGSMSPVGVARPPRL